MPGLVGFTRAVLHTDERPLEILSLQQRLVSFAPTYYQGECFSDELVAGTYATTDQLKTQSSPFVSGDLIIWFQGDIYNSEELVKGSKASPAEVLAQLVQQDSSFSFLAQIDGIYNAVVYDIVARKIHFLTDRYGFEHLYYAELGSGLAWACEAKAFLPFNGFSTAIDEASLDDFFTCGHLREDRTWFRDAKLFPPGARWTWDLNESRFVCRETYWSYDLIPQLSPAEVDSALVEETADRFRKAVRKQAQYSKGRLGVSLSGGLDSRALFSALTDAGCPFEIATLGQKGCYDLVYASRVAKLHAGPHRVFHLDGDNWLQHRQRMVWALDGQLDLQHMSFAPFLGQLNELWDTHFSGFLGDATIGGSYLEYPDTTESQVLLNRGRRFVTYGLQQGRLYYREQIPFFDNKFFDLVMSVPAELRRNSRFYIQVLKRLLPPELMRVKWETTGLPPSAPEWCVHLSSIARKVEKRLTRYTGVSPRRREMIDPSGWLVQESGQHLLSTTLLEQHAELRELRTSQWYDELCNEIRRLASRKGKVGRVSCALTLEIWLRAVRDWKDQLV